MREGSHVLQEIGAISPLYVLHHHTEVLLALKAAVHRHDEGVVREGEDISLGKHLLHLDNDYRVINTLVERRVVTWFLSMRLCLFIFLRANLCLLCRCFTR